MRKMKKKKKKKILGGFNCTKDKMDKEGENKTQKLYRCCSNHALSKLIVDYGLEDLWRWRTQILPNSPTTIGLLARQGLY